MSIEIRKSYNSIYSNLFFPSSFVIPFHEPTGGFLRIIKEKKKEIIFYLFLFCLLASIIIYIFLKLKYGFWFYQPVYHWYDVSYYFRSSQIIMSELPKKKNKYVNTQAISFFGANDMNQLQWTKALNAISHFYLNEKENKFNPSFLSLSSIFINNGFFFFSFYQQPQTMFHHTSTSTGNGLPLLTKEEKTIGIMSSRKVEMHLTKEKINEKENQFFLYYVDFLCVNPIFRKQGIAPQLIATHYYCQSHADPQTPISLFKREGDLTGIVPLTVYQTKLFDLKHFLKPSIPFVKLNSNYKLVLVNKSNFSTFWDFIKEKKNKYFDVFIFEKIETLLLLIEQNIFFFFYLIDMTPNNTIVNHSDNSLPTILSVYCFRNSFISISNHWILNCFACIRDENFCSCSLFFYAFVEILKFHIPTQLSFELSIENKNEKNKLPPNVTTAFSYLTIENISHGGELTTYIFQNQNIFYLFPLLSSPTAFFFYNYIFHVKQSNKCLVIL